MRKIEKAKKIQKQNSNNGNEMTSPRPFNDTPSDPFETNTETEENRVQYTR